MDGFKAIEKQTMDYDKEKDGVWMYDDGVAVAFLPRNTIIKLIGTLID